MNHVYTYLTMFEHLKNVPKPSAEESSSQYYEQRACFSIDLGRCSGKTIALHKIIMENPDSKFLLVSPLRNRMLYSCVFNKVNINNNLKQTTIQNYNADYPSFRNFDYILFDECYPKNIVAPSFIVGYHNL